jgi:hypothetical protein
MKKYAVAEQTRDLARRFKFPLILVACMAMLLVGSGCSLSSQAASGGSGSEDLLYPKKQLCRIGKTRSSGRYVALITPNCAADSTQLGLKSSYSRADLESLGAN